MAASAPQSVDRIFTILDHLAGDRSGETLAGLARRAAAPKTSLVGLLAGMVAGGYLARDADGRYTLGPRMVTLAMRVTAKADLTSLARPVLTRLVEATGETALLGTLAPDADVAMYIDKVESANPVRYTVALGERRALYCSAMGKLLLAHMGPERREAYIKSERYTAFTPTTITSARAMRAQVDAIRAEGIARTDSELVASASALAAPVFGPGGAFLVGLGLAGPSERMRAKRSAFERALREAARDLTALAAGAAPETA
jgi:IclR family transcriptional regulator, acetate operon repressor